MELTTKPMYEADRILKWRRAKVGRKNTREFLITWENLALDKVEWLVEAGFGDLEELHNRIKEDRSIEKNDEHINTDKPTRRYRDSGMNLLPSASTLGQTHCTLGCI